MLWFARIWTHGFHYKHFGELERITQSFKSKLWLSLSCRVDVQKLFQVLARHELLVFITHWLDLRKMDLGLKSSRPFLPSSYFFSSQDNEFDLCLMFPLHKRMKFFSFLLLSFLAPALSQFFSVFSACFHFLYLVLQLFNSFHFLRKTLGAINCLLLL